MAKPELTNEALASTTNTEYPNHHDHDHHTWDHVSKPEFANRVLASPTDGDKLPPQILSVFSLHFFPSLLHIITHYIYFRR